MPRVEKLERGHDRTASVIEVLVEDIDRLAREVEDMKALPPVTKRRIGFIIDDERRSENWRSQFVRSKSVTGRPTSTAPVTFVTGAAPIEAD